MGVMSKSVSVGGCVQEECLLRLACLQVRLHGGLPAVTLTVEKRLA